VPSPHAAALALALLATALPTHVALPGELALPQPVPEVVQGFTLAPVAALAPGVGADPSALLAALAFGPGEEGQDLYGVTTTGDVVRFPLAWTPAGPLSLQPVTRASGFTGSLGLAFRGDALYVADTHGAAEHDGSDGRVTRLLPGQSSQAQGLVVVDGLPNLFHTTEHLRFGPDGRLYVANGNGQDHGEAEPDARPYSGGVFSVDPDEVALGPAVLHWQDAQGQPIPRDQLAAHPRNADFAAKARVLGSGFRNAFGVAFAPGGQAYVSMNGPDLPDAQDVLYRVAPGTDYGFPWCVNAGPPGGVGAQVHVVPSAFFNDASRCVGVQPATALLGWHVCATGLDVPTPGVAAFPPAFQSSVFVAECGPFSVPQLLARLAEEPSTHDTGHKVARVALGAQGEAVGVTDFVTGLALPTDAVFGPDGALYIADVQVVWRVAPLA
jgi:glucose/arabinose dehydrogenase